MAAQADLAGAEAELEKQRTLNEKLENDLLQIQTHNPTPKTMLDGQNTPAEDDVLAGLDLGKKLTVGISRPVSLSPANMGRRSFSHRLPGIAQFPSHHRQTHQYCLL
jgi:hypothetical protein